MILTKSAIPGEVKITFSHTDIWNNYLGKNVNIFSLAVFSKSPTVVSVDAKHAYASTGDKIRLPITEVILCASIRDLAHLKKIQDWVPTNAVLLVPVLTKVAITYFQEL